MTVLTSRWVLVIRSLQVVGGRGGTFHKNITVRLRVICTCVHAAVFILRNPALINIAARSRNPSLHESCVICYNACILNLGKSKRRKRKGLIDGRRGLPHCHRAVGFVLITLLSFVISLSLCHSRGCFYIDSIEPRLKMADLEAVLADVSYLMAMEKSKSTPAARASKKIILPEPR